MDSQSGGDHHRNASVAQSNASSGGSSSSAANSSSSSSHHEPRDPNAPIIKATDMPDVVQQHAIQCAVKALETAEQEGGKKDLQNLAAKYIKKEFDATYGGVWHVVVGRNFGSFVVHQSRSFIYFYLGQIAVLIFKSGSAPLV